MAIEPINTRLLTKGPLQVRIVKVESPTFFWVHIGESREDLDELVEELSRRMTRRSHFLRPRPDRVMVGEVFAIREGKRWQRGLVSRIERGDVVTLVLRDWGRVVKRHITEIYILEDRFQELEWIAVPCGLAHIQPVKPRTKWDRRVKELTKLLLEGREGWMRIRGTHLDEAAAVDFKLDSNIEDEEKDLKKLLTQMGCIQHNDQLMFRSSPNQDTYS